MIEEILMEDQSNDSLQCLAASEISKAFILQDVVGKATIFQSQMGPLSELSNSLLRTAMVNFELPIIDFSPILNAFYDSLKPVFDSFKKLNPVIAQASVIMANNGWWVVRFLPIAFYSKLINVEHEITPGELTGFITNYANRKRCEQLTKMVSTWDVDIFRSRKEIFEQALWAHARKKYAVTVPALIVQVEGIIREFVASYDGGFTSWRLEPIMNRFKQKFAQIESAPQKQEMDFAEVEALMNYHNLKTLEKLYAAYDPRSHTDPSDVNRNAVSHGLWLSYSTKETSTKLFLLLDMLHSMLHQLKERSKA